MDSSATNLLILSVYYIVVGLMGFFSLFGVYILIRYGKSTIFALAVSILYAIFFLQILAESALTLRSLLS